ncbi:tRNA ligase subunit PheS family protein, partial [Staphylococcus saprophyticus]
LYHRDSHHPTHTHQFTQIQELLLHQNIKITHFKPTLQLLPKQLFPQHTQIPLPPTYFPFTQPSLQLHLSSFKCNPQGSNLC